MSFLFLKKISILYFLCCYKFKFSCIYIFPRDIEILGWCPAGPVLPHGGEGASLALVGHPSRDGVTIKMPYVVDVLH